MSPSTRARSRRATRLAMPSTGSLEAMPESIVLHILARVPSSALARLACTCHDFNDLLVPTALPMRAELLGQRLCPRPGESVLAALRFAKNWSLRVIVYDLEAIATSDYPPPPPVPAKSLAGLLQEERDKVHVEKPKKQKKNAAGKHNQVGPGDVAIAPPSNPITL